MFVVVNLRSCFFFFFKQKTAYEMLISDWSSDVCSSDLHKPIVIAADSREEALTFLSAGFSPQDAELGKFRDRVIIFREVGALSKLAAQVSNFIPVILSREVEKEFAPYRASMPSFII